MLGLLGATSLAIAGMVGAGILILPGIMSVYGTYSIAGWFLSAFMVLSIAMIFSRLNTHYKGQTPAECIANVFGEHVGFTVLFGYFTAMCFSGSCVAMTCGQYVQPLITSNLSDSVIGLLCVIVLFILNVISHSSSVFILILLVIAKIVFFSLIGGFGLMNFASYQPVYYGPMAIISSASVAVFAFLGIEYAAVSGDNVKDPEKTVPRATYLALLFSTVLFIGIHCAVLFTLPHPELSARPVYDAVYSMFGPRGAYLFAWFGVISCLTTLNGIITVEANIFATMRLKKWIIPRLGSQTCQGFTWPGSFVFLIATFVVLNTALKPLAVYFANSFVGILYMLCVFVDMKKSGLGVLNILALLSSFIIMYNISQLVFITMIIVYTVGYLFYRTMQAVLESSAAK